MGRALQHAVLLRSSRRSIGRRDDNAVREPAPSRASRATEVPVVGTVGPTSDGDFISAAALAALIDPRRPRQTAMSDAGIAVYAVIFFYSARANWEDDI
ncbi:MAG TPA: hypothetical protein VGC30_07445 [Dokdonella sp.]